MRPKYHCKLLEWIKFLWVLENYISAFLFSSFFWLVLFMQGHDQSDKMDEARKDAPKKRLVEPLNIHKFYFLNTQGLLIWE